MALDYESVDFRGHAAEGVLAELFFQNDTIAKNAVMFEDRIKAEAIFTESSLDVTMQPYTCGVPTPAGTIGLFDAIVTPAKFLYYDEFCLDPNRFSRFKRDMKPGAWEVFSNEFNQVVMEMYKGKIASDVEMKFWNNATAATKTAVAALTAGTGQTSVGAAEKTLVAATTAGLWDGVVTKMIYNNSNEDQTSAVGGRIKVVGTTITSTNIKAEYEKVYAAIPAVVLATPGKDVVIYAPRSHKQLINIANNVNTNYTKPFDVSGDNYSFYGIPIIFVPIPENVLIAGPKQHFFWATDLVSDYAQITIDKVAPNSDMWFVKVVATEAAHVGNQEYNVLYVG